MKPQPIVFIWKEVEIVDADGVAVRQMAMVPIAKYANVAKRQYTDGEQHTLTPVEERSMASHNQFMAAVGSYYDNLPEKIAARWPSAQHFRKWCLCEVGFFEEKEFDMASEKHAKMLGIFVRTQDEYARIVVYGTKVVVRRAKSQSLAAMGKIEFEASKKAILELAEAMVGTPVRTMLKEANRHA